MVLHGPLLGGGGAGPAKIIKYQFSKEIAYGGPFIPNLIVDFQKFLLHQAITPFSENNVVNTVK